MAGPQLWKSAAMADSSPFIWTSSWCFSIPRGLRLKPERLASIEGREMGQRFRKSQPSCRPTVYVPERRPRRNKTERLRKQVLRMKRWIERALNVGSGDLGRGVLLCSCLFLVICSYKIGSVAGAALFLSRFQASQLAYADICSAVLVLAVIAGYVVIARRVVFRDLLVGSMLFFSTTCAVFWGLAHYYSHLVWVFPAFYVWVKIFGVLGATQIWTLANYVLTTREAKRVFGMVGGGGIAGGIFAGFLSKTMAGRFGTESLLLAMTLFVLICAGLVIVVWRSGRMLVGDAQRTAGGSAEAPRNMSASLQLLFASPYLRAIAAVICIS